MPGYVIDQRELFRNKSEGEKEKARKRRLEEAGFGTQTESVGGPSPEKNPNLIKRNFQVVLADLNELGKSEPAFWPCAWCIWPSPNLIAYHNHLLQHHAVTMEQVVAKKKLPKTTVAFQEEARKMKAAEGGVSETTVRMRRRSGRIPKKVVENQSSG